ncbi:MAG: phosphotransferase [Oscillibacter sp.]|nr:phosphotransferase [Oscillibacter sp.]MBD5168649.1 phosphotransferase [Oscillibacter sp.]
MTMQDRLCHGTALWQLDALSPVYEGTSKAVYQAESMEYGPVILKINPNLQEAEHETAALSAGTGGGYCKLYASNLTLGLLLEERICPGISLRREPDPVQRIACFHKIFRRIHTNAPSNGETYLDWLERAETFCQHDPAGSALREDARRARQIGESMFAAYPERVLLHGDLHHDNILLDAQSGYRAIDPKGIAGPPIFDIPRFLLNELEPEDPDALSHMEMVLQLTSRTSGFPLPQLRELLYMEAVLANVWCAEDGEPLCLSDLQIAVRLLHH